MKKYISVIFILFIMSFLLCGCGEKESPEFSEGRFVSLTSTIIGIEEENKCYTINIDLEQDGGGLIYANDFSEEFGLEDCPTRSFSLSAEEVEMIKEVLVERDIFNMRRDVGNKDMVYGERKYVKVYTNMGEFSTGGLNPSNKDFLSIYDSIYDKVREEVFAYTTEIDSMIAEQYNAKVSGRNIIITDNMQYELLCANDIKAVSIEGGEDDLSYLVIELDDDTTSFIDEYTAFCNEEPQVLRLYIKGDLMCQIDVSYHISDGRLCISEDNFNQDLNDIVAKLQEIINSK